MNRFLLAGRLPSPSALAVVARRAFVRGRPPGHAATRAAEFASQWPAHNLNLANTRVDDREPDRLDATSPGSRPSGASS